MAQGDLNVANQSGAAFRADLNNQLAALGTLQSGASAPSTTFAYMLWADTTTGILKLRNAANSAWINVGTLASTNLGLALAASPTFTGTATFAGDVTMSGTGFLDVPVGTTAQRPASPTSGMVRFNTTTAQFEGYGTAAWSQLGNTALSGTNRIINGDMRIDQRNNGTSVTINSATNTYVMDRWFGVGQAADGVFSLGRSAIGLGSFSNGQLVTVTTADASIGATQAYAVIQKIEGNNVSDFSFGAVNASSVTLSFWVFSTVAGTFGGALANEAHNRSCPFSYTVAAANTWEYKTITLPGDTGGTWVTDSNSAMRVIFAVGVGSSLKGTAGVWAAGTLWSASGTVDLISTLNAQRYVTGVQLEIGTVATPFERRSYGHELALCQRYYLDYGTFHIGMYGGTNAQGDGAFPVQMRATPSLSYTDVSSAPNQVSIWNGTFNTSTFGTGGISPDTRRIACDATVTFSSAASTWLRAYNVKLSAEL